MYPYVGVPDTTQEAIANPDHGHPIESDSSETLTFAGSEAPEAPKLSRPTVAWKSLITPIGTLVFAVILAVGHHIFNAWEHGSLVYDSPGSVYNSSVNVNSVIPQHWVPQHWVTRIGIGFSFGFKPAVGVTMGFVLLQCLWLSVVRQSLTIQEIDTMYRIERQDQLYKTLPRALFFSPTIVIFSALTLLLPLSGVFAPSSLTVAPKIFYNVSGPCMIPTGNLSTPNTPDYSSLYNYEVNSGVGGVKYLHSWLQPTPKATSFATKLFIEHRIPDLPQSCGPNCRYNASVSSFVFQCTPHPLLPLFLVPGVSVALWQGDFTGSHDGPPPLWGFYLNWTSWNFNETGTSGAASCVAVQAKYDIEVQTKAGVQSVSLMNITPIASPMLDNQNVYPSSNDTANTPSNMVNFLMQLASICDATRQNFLGGSYFQEDGSTATIQSTTTSVGSWVDSETSILKVPDDNPTRPPRQQIIWKDDVLERVEEMSHNISIALLTLQLGTMSSICLFDLQLEVYQYSPFALWVPYGIALGVALISLIFAVVIMGRNNTGQITTSFSDTAILTGNVDKEVSAGAKLRLRATENGKLEYILEETNGTSK